MRIDNARLVFMKCEREVISSSPGGFTHVSVREEGDILVVLLPVVTAASQNLYVTG